MPKINYKQLPYQKQFHESIKKKVYLSAGYGAGKTYSLVMKMFQLMSKNKKCPGGILAPDLKMFKKDVLPTIKDICRENSISYSFNKQDSFFTFPTTKTIVYVFHSVDDGASIRGPNLGWGVINEVTLCSKGAFDAFLARIRIKNAPFKQLAMSGTPEAFNWAYEYFIESPRQDTEMIFGDMRLNTHIDEGYAKMLTESYDNKLIEAYVEGRFVNMTGNRAAYAFNRHKHCVDHIEYDPTKIVWVSQDFNINPMAATLWHRLPIGSKHLIEAFDEIELQGSDTYEMAKVLKERLGGVEGVIIYPDPAGAAGSTKSKGHRSDIDILKEAGFKDIKYKPRIPSVRDCLNALNNGFDKDRILISRKCKNLIADLEQCVTKQGTGDIDKSNPKRTHWLDGLKNMYEYEFPAVGRGVSLRQPRIR